VAETKAQKSGLKHGNKKVTSIFELESQMDKDNEGTQVQLLRKPSQELYLGLDPISERNYIPFRNLHNKVHFKTIE